MKILGVGLEILDHQTWNQKISKKGKTFLKDHFTAFERKYCDQKRNSPMHYGVRWACKNAVIQALGFSKKSKIFKNIEIKSNSSGVPKVYLRSKMVQKKNSFKIKEIKLSLSHSDHYSVAEVIVLG